MCLFTTTPKRSTWTAHPHSHRDVLDPPPRSSRYSSHPPAGVVRLPRGSTTSYRRSSASLSDMEYRRSVNMTRERSRSRTRPREIEYVEYEEPRARSRRRSVSVVRVAERDPRESRGSFVVVGGNERRRSVSRRRVEY